MDSVDGEAGDGVPGDSAVVELRKRVREVEQRCQAERRQTELAQRERESMKRELLQAQEQVSYSAVYSCLIPLTTPYPLRIIQTISHTNYFSIAIYSCIQFLLYKYC